MVYLRMIVLLVTLGCCVNARADVVLSLDQSTLQNTGGNSWSIDAIILLNNIGDSDLTNPPQISGVNLDVSFVPAASGLAFVNVTAPSSGAIFGPSSSPAYTSFVGSPPSQMFASVDSTNTNPVANGGKVLTVNFQAVSVVPGNYQLTINPSFTFYTLSGEETAISFDNVTSATFTVAVPEAGSFAFLTLTLGVAGALLRFKKRYDVVSAGQQSDASASLDNRISPSSNA